MRLHLGCSDVHKPGYLGVDVCEPPPWATEENFLREDLSGLDVHVFPGEGFLPDSFAAWEPAPWPWEDSSVDEIIAHDVFEHIDNMQFRGNAGMIWTFNESWRVLKPGGKLDLIVPCLPGSAPFVDPTHKVVYHADNAFYFTERWNHPQGERGRLGDAYDITALFRTVGGRSYNPKAGPEESEWVPINYAPRTDRHKLFLVLEAVK